MLVQTTSELEHQVNEIFSFDGKQSVYNFSNELLKILRGPHNLVRKGNIHRQLQRLSGKPWQVLTCPVHLPQGKGSDRLGHRTVRPPQV